MKLSDFWVAAVAGAGAVAAPPATGAVAGTEGLHIPTHTARHNTKRNIFALPVLIFLFFLLLLLRLNNLCCLFVLLFCFLLFAFAFVCLMNENDLAWGSIYTVRNNDENGVLCLFVIHEHPCGWLNLGTGAWNAVRDQTWSC